MAGLRERVVVTGGSAGLGLSIVVALAQTPLVAGRSLGVSVRVSVWSQDGAWQTASMLCPSGSNTNAP